jgi:Xaa-Pro aminopeptidase
MPLEAYAPRRDRLRALLAARAVDALLVTDLVNVRYLCGFSGSAGALLVTPGGAVLATDGRYTEQVATEAPDVELAVTRSVAADLAVRARDLGVAALGFEEHHLTVASHVALIDAVAGLPFVAAGRPVEELRRVKDSYEVALVAEACAIGDRAFADVEPLLRPGSTEIQIAHALEARMLVHGAEERGFATIAASGPNSSIPHHQPTARPIEPGDFVKMDFGARYGGYRSDMTRTVVVGAEPAQWQRDLYELVAGAQRAGCTALAAGALLAQVDAAARDPITAAGHGDHFPHGLGHGVGLVIHEDPFFAKTGTAALEAGATVTIEPGVYLPGRGGVRIEDTLLVTEQGSEPLTRTTRELLVLR